MLPKILNWLGGATEQLPRPDGTWIVRVTVRDREHKIQGDVNATQAERYKAAAWLASVYGGDWQGWYQRAWGEAG